MTIEALLTDIRDELKTINSKMSHIGGAVTQGASYPQEAPPAASPAPVQVPSPVTAEAGAAKGKKAAPTGKAAAQGEVAPPVSYDTVKSTVQKQVAAGKRDAVVALLGTYGAKNAQELSPEQYPDALAKLLAL